MGFNIQEFIRKVEEFAQTMPNSNSVVDGKLDDFEKQSIFVNGALSDELSAAISKGEISENDAKSIFGLELQKPAQQTEVASSPSKTSKKMMEDDIYDRVFTKAPAYFMKEDGKVADKVDWDAFATDLTNEILGPNVDLVNREYYTKLVSAAKTVADTVKNYKYNSRSDVEHLYQEISKRLNISDNDEMGDVKSGILKHFMIVIEKHQKAKENEILTNEYRELRKTMSRKDAVEKMNKNPRFKGSYYDSYYSREYNERFHGVARESVHPGLLNEMEDGIVLEDARNEVWNAIWAQRGTGITDGYEIEKAAKKALGKNADKYTAKVFRGELSFSEKLNWKRSTIKDFRKSVAAYNRVEQLKQKHWSEKEITDELKFDKVFAQMLSVDKEKYTQLISRNSDGSYNISELSDLIRDCVSYADYRANYQQKDQATLGEIESVMRAIKVKTGVDVTRKDAKNLIDMCGFDRDKRNLLKDVYNGVLGGLGGYLTALSTAYAVTSANGEVTTNVTFDTTKLTEKLKNTSFPMTNILRNPLNVNIDIVVTTIIDGVQVQGTTTINKFDIMYKLSQQGFLPGEYGFDLMPDGSYKLWIKQGSDIVDEKQAKLVEILGEDFNIPPEDIEYKEDIQQDDAKTERDKAIVLGMLIAVALGILNQLLKELPGEKAILTTDFQAKNVEEYANELSKEPNLPEAARPALLQIAQYYYNKDGNLDGYHELLRQAAGGSSVLNKDELLFALFAKLKELDEVQPEPKPEPSKPEPKPEPKPELKPEPKPEPKPEKEWEATSKPEMIPQTKFHSWQDIVKGYSCFDKPEFKKTYRSGTDASGKPIYVSVANRMVKIIQAMDVSGIKTVDELREFYDIQKIKAFAEDTLKLGSFKKAKAKHPDFPIDEAAFNAALKSSGGVIGNVYTPVLYDSAHGDDDDGLCNYSDPKEKTPIVQGNDGTAYKVETKNGVTKYYKREVGTSKWQSTDEKDYNSIKRKVPYQS